MKLIYRIAAATALLASIALAQPKPKSQKEVDALMAIQNAQDPNARIAAVDNLITKFADTEFKGWALYIATASAQQTNDYEKMVIYGERALEADPKNFSVMTMLASGIATHTKEFDFDKEEKLGKATKYAQGALEALKTAAKPNPQLTDEQWEQAKKDSTAEAHAALAQVAMVRKKYDVAIAEYKQAVEGAAQPEPANLVRLANAYNLANQPDNAIAVLDKIKALPEVHPAIQNAANAERNTAVKLKSGGAAPAKPAAPAPGVAPAPTPAPAK